MDHNISNHVGSLPSAKKTPWYKNKMTYIVGAPVIAVLALAGAINNVASPPEAVPTVIVETPTPEPEDVPSEEPTPTPEPETSITEDDVFIAGFETEFGVVPNATLIYAAEDLAVAADEAITEGLSPELILATFLEGWVNSGESEEDGITFFALAIFAYSEGPAMSAFSSDPGFNS